MAAAGTIPPQTDSYDGITSEELFDSFMSVALDAEKDNFHAAITNVNNIGEIPNGEIAWNNVDDMEGSDNETPSENVKHIQMPLPLLVKLQSEPIYETCDQTKLNVSCSKTAESNYAVVDKNNPAEQNISEPSYAIVAKNEKKENVVIEDSYAQVHKTDHSKSVEISSQEVQKSMPVVSKADYAEISHPFSTHENVLSYPQYDLVTKHTLQDITGLYAVPDKQKNNNVNRAISTLYADVSVLSTNNSDMPIVKPEKKDSEYSEVILKEPPVNSSASEYEVINNYQTNNTQGQTYTSAGKPVAAVSPIMAPEAVLNAEQIAYSSQRLHSNGQKEIYNSCLQTIDRGNTQMSPHSSSNAGGKEKRNLFSFGKAKHSDNSSGGQHIRSSTAPNKKSAVMQQQDHREPYGEKLCMSAAVKRQSSMSVLCAGYLFKQGGTGFTPKNWRLRWFELKKDNCLYYYKSEQDPIPSGAVMLLKYAVTRASEVNKRFAFKLVKGGARTYLFAANSDDEMKRWMKNLSEASKYAISDHTSIPECSLKNVSIAAVSITEPDCHGFLYKQGNSHKSWKRRYCVLKYGCLFYYEDMSDTVAIGVFKLHNYSIKKNASVKYGFEAEPPVRKMRTYHFHAETEIDSKRWVEALKHSVASFQ